MSVVAKVYQSEADVGGGEGETVFFDEQCSDTYRRVDAPVRIPCCSRYTDHVTSATGGNLH